MENRRFDWVDTARGIGILLVVYGHVLDGLRKGSSYVPGFTYDVIYSFHLALFFFLSGFFIKKFLSIPFKEAILSKVRTIIVPYFIFGFFEVILLVIMNRYTNSNFSILNIIALPVYPVMELW